MTALVKVKGRAEMFEAATLATHSWGVEATGQFRRITAHGVDRYPIEPAGYRWPWGQILEIREGAES